LTPPVELIDKEDQGAKIVSPKAAPSARQGEERIGSLHIGPGGRQRAHALLLGQSEEDPVLTPGVGVPDEFELPARQWVEGVGHTETRRNRQTTCS